MFFGIFNESMGKVYQIWKIEVQRSTKVEITYGLLKLLFYFIGYCQGQHNNKHTKIALNLTKPFFESHWNLSYSAQNNASLEFLLN